MESICTDMHNNFNNNNFDLDWIMIKIYLHECLLELLS